MNKQQRKRCQQTLSMMHHARRRERRKRVLDAIGILIIIVCVVGLYQAIRYAYTTDYENCINRGIDDVFTDMDVEMLERKCSVPFTNARSYE